MPSRRAVSDRYLWEILVPTVVPNTDGRKFFTTRFHKVWDTKVRAITGGLTVMRPAKGQWVSPGGTLFEERMIPVRLMCSLNQIDQIAGMTLDYYAQEAVMYYRISDEVVIKHHPTRKNKS